MLCRPWSHDRCHRDGTLWAEEEQEISLSTVEVLSEVFTQHVHVCTCNLTVYDIVHILKTRDII